MTRRVTAAELEHGWNCETCHRPFTEGAAVYGVLVAVTSDGTVIESDYQCQLCWCTNE